MPPPRARSRTASERRERLPKPEVYVLQDVRQFIPAPDLREKAGKDAGASDKHEDPRSAVRLNWQALDFQVKRSRSGKTGAFGIIKRRNLQWPDIERHEEEETTIIGRPLGTEGGRRSIKSNLAQASVGGMKGADPAKRGQMASNSQRRRLEQLPKTTWPQLVAQATGHGSRAIWQSGNANLVEELKTPDPASATVVVKGVSSNLKPTDFTRLIGPTLTNWRKQIHKSMCPDEDAKPVRHW